MRLKELYGQPGYLIRRVHQRSTAEFAAATSGADITQVQLSILLAISELPGIDAARISELIGSDRTTIGQALLRLEKRDLIRREKGTHDKRTKRLVVTAKGKNLFTSLAPLVPRIGSNILEVLTRRERETLLRILAKLVARTEGAEAVESVEDD